MDTQLKKKRGPKVKPLTLLKAEIKDLNPDQITEVMALVKSLKIIAELTQAALLREPRESPTNSEAEE